MNFKAINLLAIALLCGLVVMAKGKKEGDKTYQFTPIVEIPTTPVKDQASSGTCWSYATTSFIETEMLRLGNDIIDLSEMFFVHYAYQQKALKYSRYQGLTNFSQGGQGHDVTNVAAEYGLVPEEAYSGLNYGTNAHQHSELEKVMKATLDASLQSKRSFTGRSLDVVDETLNLYLGEIPETFTYNEKEYTPKSFAASTGFNANDYVELTSFQCYDFYKQVDLELPDNWSHDDYYNVPLKELMQVIDNAFSMGYSVNWDGDVSEQGFSHRNAIAVVPEDDPTQMEDGERAKWEALTESEQGDFLFGMNHIVKEKIATDDLRQQWFDTFKTTDDHLMHLVGTAKDQNGTLYYITKNSWADDSNSNGGMLYMSRNFVELKTTAIQIHKDVIPADLKAKLGIE